MKLLGRSPSEPGEVTKVSGLPDGAPLGAAVPPGPADLEEAATPVPTRLQRLGAVLDRARPGRAGRNVRKWLETIGMALIVFGFVCILIGWYGAAHSPYLYQEVPYLISGGLLGVALVIGGGILVRSGWSMRQVEEERRNALAIVRSVDRLERILRSLEESRHAAPRPEDEHVR